MLQQTRVDFLLILISPFWSNNLPPKTDKERIMAHHAVWRQVLLVKIDQKLLRLESELLVHDLNK